MATLSDRPALNLQIVHAAVFAILLVLSMSTIGCVFDPGTVFEVENKTDRAINVFIAFDGAEARLGGRYGEVPPGSKAKLSTTAIWPKPTSKTYVVTAKTTTGDVVYSKSFTWQQLKDTGYRIVIPPSPGP